MLGRSAEAQQQPTMEELMRKIDQLQKRVDQLEGELKTTEKPGAQPRTAAVARHAEPRKPAKVAAAPPAAAPPAAGPLASAHPPAAAAPSAPLAIAATPPLSAAEVKAETRKAAAEAVAAALDPNIPGLSAPEPMGNQFADEDALRSDLPGLAIRIPGTQSEVRLYGFAKLSSYYDLNGRNQTDAPPAQTIPLAGSAADQQGGDFGMTGRFSRIGVDSRTLTGWGTLETRIEGDFGGGSPTSSNAVFRLRQAWAELGTEEFRVLAGQANSLWNEGIFETLIDATNLNQSFIRQAQIRATGRLAPGLTGMISLEAADTQYTSVNGVYTPGSVVNGGASPAFNTAPDLLGRLTYREDGLVADVRGLLRRLSVRTSGTALSPPNLNLNATGWGLAAHVSVPMRWIWDGFGTDTITGMAYYGQGIGRYFAGNTSGQDALSDAGLPGVVGGSLDPLPTYGVIVAYRRFWTPQLRSNVSYAYARQDYPSYALQFVPGSVSALNLNRDMQQVFVNLIWSPFGDIRNGAFASGFLDVGLEYLFTRRDLFGGSAMAGNAGYGQGIANRIVGAVIARF
ncbi:DcaP family trimeric outer membrane transporter [Rhodopila sp.]|uniref:DcaP family trimeric outer membrane transporter n=1 Tax=Rhodopila sp. TaxID=2480087 RepID=UPI002BE8F696|nr:DcaP family trimeric outer membrane transporter [Rhodopila sp.]HVZ07086.1 DcaP family trimeric outer membrane transporter [Rhodopila sp.]